MKYRYRQTGAIVESSTELDSMIFEPVEEDMKEVMEQGLEEVTEPETDTEENEELDKKSDDLSGEEWPTDEDTETQEVLPASKQVRKTAVKKPVSKTTTRKTRTTTGKK